MKEYEEVVGKEEKERLERMKESQKSETTEQEEETNKNSEENCRGEATVKEEVEKNVTVGKPEIESESVVEEKKEETTEERKDVVGKPESNANAEVEEDEDTTLPLDRKSLIISIIAIVSVAIIAFLVVFFVCFNPKAKTEEKAKETEIQQVENSTETEETISTTTEESKVEVAEESKEEAETTEEVTTEVTDDQTAEVTVEEPVEMVSWEEWASQPGEEEPHLVVWNEEKGKQLIIEPDSEYTLEEGDRLAVSVSLPDEKLKAMGDVYVSSEITGDTTKQKIVQTEYGQYWEIILEEKGFNEVYYAFDNSYYMYYIEK